MDPVISEIPKSEMVRIRSLWEELNRIHLQDSIYFKDHYRTFAFEDRVRDFDGVPEDDFKLSIVTNGDEALGYCLSSIHGKKGEIESLFLAEKIRKENFGKTLVDRHLEWFKQRKCGRVIVTVSYGHDSVLGFYHKMGFFERLIQLDYKF
ncbi:MAG TPA: GNAT family N-acetyltransferase [Fibrobacteria bacterium]|nr:GNAT family N-acetyltransferase [Fibrobacteria bacterium]